MSEIHEDDVPLGERAWRASPDERPHLWDNPENVKRFLWVIYAICLGLVVADFIVHRHIYHPWEGFPAFYAIYGWVACVTLVLVAKQLRKILIRTEDYYDGV